MRNEESWLEEFVVDSVEPDDEIVFPDSDDDIVDVRITLVAKTTTLTVVIVDEEGTVISESETVLGKPDAFFDAEAYVASALADLEKEYEIVSPTFEESVYFRI